MSKSTSTLFYNFSCFIDDFISSIFFSSCFDFFKINNNLKVKPIKAVV